MEEEKELPKRKHNRLKYYDYSRAGAYFITICTKDRCKILSHIVGVDVPDDPKNVVLLPFGEIANKY